MMTTNTRWQILQPAETHTRPASCTEYQCEGIRNGWVTTVDEATALGQKQAHYIRTNRASEYVELSEDGKTKFVFKPGHNCFHAHRVPLEREAFFRIVGGAGNMNVSPSEWHGRSEQYFGQVADLRAKG